MMRLFQYIRLESLLINLKILLILLALLMVGHSYTGVFCREGIYSYLCVAIAFDTSIAVGWVRRRILRLFRKNIVDASLRCASHCTAGDIPQKSVLSFNENAVRLNARLREILKRPSFLYPTFGIVFALLSSMFLLIGIPDCIRQWIVVAPFPALGFYATSLLAYADMFVQLNGSLYDRRQEAVSNKMKNRQGADPNVELVFDASQK